MKQNRSIKYEISDVINALKSKGVHVNSHKEQQSNFGSDEETVGLGDVVESVFKSYGITEERFKKWFGLKECGCSERKAWLNGLFSWKVKQNEN